MLPSVTPSLKYSQVLMAMNLKDEHTEHRTQFLHHKPQTLDMLSVQTSILRSFFLVLMKSRSQAPLPLKPAAE